MRLSFKSTVVSFCFLALNVTALTANASFWNYYKPKLQPTITDVVSNIGGEFDDNPRDFDLLLNAVLAAGLEGALADRNASFTVFAPNDGAFIKLAQDLGYVGSDESEAFAAIVGALTTLGDGDPIPLLTDVLLYHVSPEKKGIYRVIYSDSIDTLLDGATLTPDFLRLVDNEPDVDNPRYVYPINLRAANGIIHAINRVLLPLDLDGNSADAVGTIVDVVVASGGTFDEDLSDYDVLLNAVQAANLVDPLQDPAADLTVFAPNDAAFVRLARDFGYRGKDEGEAFSAIVELLTELGGGDPIPLLTDILLYHVSPTSKTVKQVSDAEKIETLLTDATFTSYGLFLIDGAPKLRAPKIRTRASNIRVTNGIIHTISRVLIPLDVTPVSRSRKH